LSDDKYNHVRRVVATIIHDNFDKIPNAVKLLEKLVYDVNNDVRIEAIDAIRHNFSKIPNAEELLKKAI